MSDSRLQTGLENTRPARLRPLTWLTKLLFNQTVMHKNRLAGRFLPSRVYARWVWTVRSALLVLPSILFLAGALVLFFQPTRYESTAAFRYLGDRTLPGVESLLKSSRLSEHLVKDLELNNQWNVDTETAVSIILKNTKIKVDPEIGLIEIKATHTDREEARNIADAMVAALENHEESVARAALSSRIEEAHISATRTRDKAELEKQLLARLISVRTDSLADPIAQLDIDAARKAWERTLAQASEIESQTARMTDELSLSRKWIEVHTKPKIAQNPAEKNSDESLGALIVRVLLIGLFTALALPYLLELIYPRRSRAKKADLEVTFENPILLEATVNR